MATSALHEAERCPELRRRPLIPVICLPAYLALNLAICANGQGQIGSGDPVSGPGKGSLAQTGQTMPASLEPYRTAVLNLLLQEANTVARQLQLPEKLPIDRSDLMEMYIAPARLARGMRAPGNVSTRDYTYCASVDNKFSFLEKRFEDPVRKDYESLKAKYLWPVSQLDTNGAYKLATQWLRDVSMDVEGLGRDCQVEISPWLPDGSGGARFVPLYWVVWRKGGKAMASVELFEPAKSLRQLRVERPEYILRKPLAVTNLYLGVWPAEAPRGTNASPSN
jgi:hypothetical protein